MAGSTSACAAVWKVAIRSGPADAAGHLLEVGLGLLEAGDHHVGVRHQPVPGLGELHAAPDALEQLDAGVALQRGQLLRDGRRRVGERVRDGGDRAPLGELAQAAGGAGRPAS